MIPDQNDPECANAPFGYTMNVRWFIQALDPNSFVVAENSDVNFNVNVVNPCPNDVLGFETPITSFIYNIDQFATPVQLFPSVVQRYPQCLRIC